MTWEPMVYRDIWADDVRLFVDGKDVTYFRGVPSQVGGYQLQEPYAFGPADFSFPQVTNLEVDKFEVKGALSWMRLGAPVELVPVKDGHREERIWAGFITSISPGMDATAIHCDGALSGRLALWDRQPAVFEFTKDTGLLVYDAILGGAGIGILPHFGPTTGIRRSNLSSSGTALDFVNELLAGALTADGNQWTIGRLRRRYEMRLKDFTTVHATVFLGAEGVSLDATRDLQEEPTTIYGTGTQPDGQKIINAVAPNLLRGEAADYPFADGRSFGKGTRDEETDGYVEGAGGGIYVMIRKLVGQGFMSRAEGSDNEYDDDTVDAVRALQRRAGLPRTGVMNPRTWRALFNITVTGRSLYGARVLPMAELPEVQRFFYTSNGSRDEANPDYDPGRVPVSRTIDWGAGVWKKDMLKASDRELDRIHGAKNWVGTLALENADVFAGDVNRSTANPTPMSRMDLREGMNIKVVGFDGNTRFHIAGINVDGDRNVRCAVDTRFRDLLTVGQIIERNKASRRHPAREFINTIRRPNAMSTQIVWSEIGGILDADTKLKGGRWNVVPIVAGQTGTVERVHVQLRNDRAKFVMAILDKDVSVDRMTHVAGSHPLAEDTPDDPKTTADEFKVGSKWAKDHVQDRLKRQLLCLYAAGQGMQPCGYYPRMHRRDNGKVTDAPITGEWRDDAGFNYRTLGHGVLYLWIFPDRDTVLQAGRILWPNFQEGA